MLVLLCSSGIDCGVHRRASQLMLGMPSVLQAAISTRHGFLRGLTLFGEFAEATLLRRKCAVERRRRRHETRRAVSPPQPWAGAHPLS